jgi:hypothetical protein
VREHAVDEGMMVGGEVCGRKRPLFSTAGGLFGGALAVSAPYGAGRRPA